ncbi:MAG: cell envelope biogenesis protein OmpA [Bacteroidota bacterium]
MTGQRKPISEEGLLLNKLKEILLREDRKALEEMQNLVNDPVALSEKVSPIIEQRLLFFKQHFPKEYQQAVDKIVDHKLKESQEEILNVIYPVLGKMIRKYIAHQFQMLKDSIDQRIRSTLSTKGFWGRIKARLFGVSDTDILLSGMNSYVIEEVYVIQRDSGLLMGSASLQQTVDRDVIAGMLTAIKSFVEDAFKRERQDLEMIQYGNYNIFIQNFHSYYIAAALSGSLSTAERDGLGARMLDFAEHELADHQELEDDNFSHISERLKNYFFNTITLEPEN